jgi:hypothetical protein
MHGTVNVKFLNVSYYIPTNTAMFIGMNSYMFRSQQISDFELRSKSLAALLNKHVCVGRTVKIVVTECEVMFIPVQTTVATSHTSRNAVLPVVCS